MQVALVMFRDNGERRRFSLAHETTIIGRREDCDLRIPLKEVSRKHCKLAQEGETLRVEDLGSSNGTWLNGRRIQEAQVEPGDTIQIGSVAFVVQVDEKPPEGELQPVVARRRAAAEEEAPDALSPTAPSDLDEAGGFDPMSVLQSPSQVGDSGEFDAVIEEIEPLEEREEEKNEEDEESRRE